MLHRRGGQCRQRPPTSVSRLTASLPACCSRPVVQLSSTPRVCSGMPALEPEGGCAGTRQLAREMVGQHAGHECWVCMQQLDHMWCSHRLVEVPLLVGFATSSTICSTFSHCAPAGRVGGGGGTWRQQQAVAAPATASASGRGSRAAALHEHERPTWRALDDWQAFPAAATVGLARLSCVCHSLRMNIRLRYVQA